ncbi:hypothetical protein UXU46_01075 [Campylobacter jejuni]
MPYRLEAKPIRVKSGRSVGSVITCYHIAQMAGKKELIQWGYGAE